jgi:addiction module HigA family antidote
MIPKHRIPTHPGEMLLEEFLKPMGLTQAQFAEHIGVDASKVSALVNGKLSVTPVMAWRLARALGTSPEVWIDLQSAHDLAKARDEAKAVKPLRKVV